MSLDSGPKDGEVDPSSRKSLQQTFAPTSICFGCGPANEKGLHIASFLDEETGDVVAIFTPEAHHAAFPGMLNGGIIGALLDCHSNWTAAHHLMKTGALAEPPCTVTSDFHVKLKRPTPLVVVKLRARVASSASDRATIEAELEAGGKITATCTGTFVAVKEGHPAYHRW